MSGNMSLKIDGRTSRGKILKDLSMSGEPLKQGILISKKLCSHCDNTPDDDETIIECMNCHHSFHTPCLLKPLSEDTVNAFTSNPSLWWFCLGCISCKRNDASCNSNSDHVEVSAPSDVVLKSSLMSFKKDILTLVGETMDTKLKSIYDLIEKNVSDKQIKTPISQQVNQTTNVIGNGDIQSYADVCIQSETFEARKKGLPASTSYKAKAEKHVLLLEPSDKEAVTSDNGKNIMSSINSAISGINVNFCSVKKSGIIAMGFNESQSKDLAQEKLNNDITCSSAVSMRVPRKLHPKVTIMGINEVLFNECNLEDKDTMKTVLLNDIIARNSSVKSVIDSSDDEFLQVVMLQKTMPSVNTVSYTAALKMSSKVRKVIYENDNKLYVSLKRCNVFDRYHVVQCYHCQTPGHLSNNCPSKKNNLSSTCFYCAGEHQSKHCPDKERLCCANCSKSNDPEVKKKARTHTAASKKCPILQYYINNVKEKTENWYEKNLKC